MHPERRTPSETKESVTKGCCYQYFPALASTENIAASREMLLGAQSKRVSPSQSTQGFSLASPTALFSSLPLKIKKYKRWPRIIQLTREATCNGEEWPGFKGTTEVGLREVPDTSL